MFRRALVLSLFVAPLVAPLAAQGAFEGTLVMSLTGDDGKSNSMNYMVKGSKVRMEIPGPKGETMAMLFDLTEKKVQILMDGQKMYMEQPVSSDATQSTKELQVVRTGKTETIAGYQCEHVIVTDADASTTDVCVARGLGTFMKPGGGSRGGPPKAEAWQQGLGADGFPMKVQKGTKVVVEVKSVDKKTLDAALFSPPADYRKFDMGGMMRRRP